MCWTKASIFISFIAMFGPEVQLAQAVAAETVSTACSNDSDSCDGTYSSLFAISHDHNDPETTVLYRVKVPSFSTGTDWSDDDNGFFYRASVSTTDGTVISSLDYVPFNGVRVDSDGAPELPTFSFIVPVDVSVDGYESQLEVEACVSQYESESGTTPRCAGSLWSETFTSLPVPSVGTPSFGTASVTFTGASSSSLAIPNNGVYPGVITVEVSANSGSLSDDEIEWLFNHIVFFDEDAGVYTNDIFDATGSSHRSAGILTLDEAAYEDPSTGKYNTKYGSSTAFSAVTATSERQFFVYTLDTLGTASFQIAVQYIYDKSEDCTGFINNGPGSIASTCDEVSSGLSAGSSISPSLSVTPDSSQKGVITAYPLNGVKAGEAENRIISFASNQSGATCGSVVNPLGINQSGTAYNPPNYVIDDDAAAAWGKSFPRALYYVLPTGFGNCNSGDTPFCHLTEGYSAYVPHYADDNGIYGSLNGGSTSEPIVGRLALADQYSFEAMTTETRNSLVWFDNCGYGYLYEECSECEYQLGSRLTLPEPPDGRDRFTYTITNNLDYPIAFGKECCASWYQQNQSSGEWEPPQEIDNTYAMYIPAQSSASYRTLFSSEVTPVYNATTGAQQFKLWLNLDNTGYMYGCPGSHDWSTSVNSTSPYGITIGYAGEEARSCTDLPACPFGMDEESSDGTTTCTAAAGSTFILGVPEWAAERAEDTAAIQIMTWGARGAHDSNDNIGGNGGHGGFALTVWEPGDLDSNLYFYEGRSKYGSSSILTGSPLSLLTSDTAQETTNPANADVILIAGGGGQGSGPESLFKSGKTGGEGATAIANTDPSGPAVSTSGGSSRGGNPSPYTGGGGTGGSNDGTSGIGGEGKKLWNTDGPLIPPESWAAGAGGSGDTGGGGFGGGASGKGTNKAGGGGGSWAAANTTYDPAAPTSRPDSPNGYGGALEFVYTTGTTSSVSATTRKPSSILSRIHGATRLFDNAEKRDLATRLLRDSRTSGDGSDVAISGELRDLGGEIKIWLRPNR